MVFGAVKRNSRLLRERNVFCCFFLTVAIAVDVELSLGDTVGEFVLTGTVVIIPDDFPAVLTPSRDP